MSEDIKTRTQAYLKTKPRTCEEYVLNELEEARKVNGELRADITKIKIEKNAALEQAKLKLDECCDSYEAQVKERDKRIEELEKFVRAICNATYGKINTDYNIYLSYYKNDRNAITFDLICNLIKQYNPDIEVNGEDNA